MGKAPEDKQSRKRPKKPSRAATLGPADLQLLFQQAPLAIAAIDRSGALVETNERWREDNWPALWQKQLRKDSSARHVLRRSFIKALRGAAQDEQVSAVAGNDDQQHFARWIMRPWQGDDGLICGAMLFVQDVTAQVEAGLLADQRNAALDAVLDNVNEAIIACDAAGHMTFTNRRVAEMFDIVHPSKANGRPQLDKLKFVEQDGVTPLDIEALPLRKALKGEIVSHQELLVPAAQGGGLSVFEANANFICGDDDVITGAVVSLNDVTAQRERQRKLKRSEAEARRIAFTDTLTGFPNRASLQRTLQQDFNVLCAKGEKLLVIVADIARFKSINAIHGDKVGDTLLAETADRMAGVAGARAIVGRLSGDEYLLLVPVPEDDPYSVLHDISAIMNGQQVVSGHMLSIQIHAGTALWPDDGMDGNTLLRRADMARREAKTMPGQTVCHFDPQLEADAQRQIQIEQDLRAAIQNDDLSIAYQPVVNSKNGKTLGFEALCRWHHSELGMIPPDVFIPAAEQTGDILDLGEWVLRQVMSDLSGYPDLLASINVSPSQFIDPQFSQRLKSALIEFDFDPRRLELEVTESLVLEDQEQIESQIKALQAIGVQLALDDFGTGYSSLAYLQTLKFNKIKIDRSFVQRLGEDREALALVQCMIQMGKSLSMTVVAEGIETEGHALMLRHAGCDCFQGYFFARPMPIDKALAFHLSGSHVDVGPALRPLKALGR
ncbi:MAG: EAL domain-containing protein [Pseudomonadota bacterium]